MSGIHGSMRSVFSVDLQLIQGLIQEVKVSCPFVLTHAILCGNRSNCCWLISEDIQDLLVVQLFLLICLFDLLSNRMRSKIEHSVTPVFLDGSSIVGDLIDCFLCDRFAQMLLEVIVIHNTSYLLIIFCKLLRAHTKPEIRVRLNPVWQVSLQSLDLRRHICGQVLILP